MKGKTHFLLVLLNRSIQIMNQSNSQTPSRAENSKKTKTLEHHHFFILKKIISNNISNSSKSSPNSINFPIPTRNPSKVPSKQFWPKWHGSFRPCLAQQLGVLWPLRCWWLSPRRGGQGGLCLGRGEEVLTSLPLPVAGKPTIEWNWDEKVCESDCLKGTWPKRKEIKRLKCLFLSLLLRVYQTRPICGPQVWLESSWALMSAKLQSCHPWASKLSCLPAVLRVEVGHCVYVAFWGWQKPSTHPMMVDDFVLKEFKQ